MKKQIVIFPVIVSLTIFLFLFSGILDADADNIIDWFDNCPTINNPTQENFDDDSFGDVCDDDIDNDNVVNLLDAFPLNGNEWNDDDFDGIGSNADLDDDNDGINDKVDVNPLPVTTQLAKKYPDFIQSCAILEPGFPRQMCFRDFFVSLVGTENIDVIISLTLSFSKSGIVDDCHFTTHDIGYVSYVKNPDLSENLMTSAKYCRNGFYHGVLSAFFDDLKKNGKDVSIWYKTACDDFVDTEQYQACLHGIGHGLVFYYENDLQSSVNTCHELSGEPFSSCMAGVMMQHTNNELLSVPSYENGVLGACSKIELSEQDSKTCYHQLGRTLAFLTNHDKDQSLNFCQLLDDENKGYCSLGVITEFIEIEQQQNLTFVFRD